MIKKLRGFAGNKKKMILTMLTMSIMVVGGAMSAFAETVDVSTTLSDSLTTVQSDILSYVALVLPIGLAIFGAFFGIKKAIGFFKGIAK